MKLHEKIRDIRRKKHISLRGLEKRLVRIYGKKALRYNSLYRIEKGLRQARTTSLSQFCVGLGISLKDLKEDSGAGKLTYIYELRKNDRKSQFVYSEKAIAQKLGPDELLFSVNKLFLDPGGKTKPEKIANSQQNAEKLVYGLKGKVVCVIEGNRYAVEKDETLAFNCGALHYFENPSTKKSSCLIIQAPKI